MYTYSIGVFQSLKPNPKCFGCLLDCTLMLLQVIKDFNLSIKPGQVVAIIGPSGGGKSTTVKLLQRFYDVTVGKVCVTILLDQMNLPLFY